MMPSRFCAVFLFGLVLAFPCHGEPPTVQADPAKGEIVIDGVLDEDIWNQRKPAEPHSASGWTSIVNPGRPAFDKRTVFLAWDQENLYVAMTAEFGDESRLPDAASTGDDTLRIDFADSALGIASSGEQIQSIMLPYLIPIRAAVRENGKGWIAEMAIPWAHLKISPKPGLQIVFNVAGQDMSGEISWAPVRNYRDVEHFGMLELR